MDLISTKGKNQIFDVVIFCFSMFRYEAGDHVAVYPVNDSDIVEGIGKRLEVDLDTIFTLTNVDGRFSNVILWCQ